jgi:hypothetical protein
MVRTGCELNRVKRSFIPLDPIHERIHLTLNPVSRGGTMRGAQDGHIRRAILPGNTFFSVFDYELMQSPNQSMRVLNSLFGIHELEKEVKRFLMVLSFQMISQILTFEGHALAKNQVGLFERQLVSLNRVGMVGQIDRELLSKLGQNRGPKWPMGVQRFQRCIDPLKYATVHFLNMV